MCVVHVVGDEGELLHLQAAFVYCDLMLGGGNEIPSRTLNRFGIVGVCCWCWCWCWCGSSELTTLSGFETISELSSLLLLPSDFVLSAGVGVLGTLFGRLGTQHRQRRIGSVSISSFHALHTKRAPVISCTGGT